MIQDHERAEALFGFTAEFYGTAAGGQWLVYCSTVSWGCRVYDTVAGKELANSDPEFPRFWINENGWLWDSLERVSSEIREVKLCG